MSRSTVAQAKTVSELFSGQTTYLIPKYQRTYSWTRKNITDLLQDLHEHKQTLEENGNGYVLNNILYVRNNHTYEIIDGQQRITTLLLLASALRDYGNEINKLNEEETGTKINTEMLHTLCCVKNYVGEEKARITDQNKESEADLFLHELLVNAQYIYIEETSVAYPLYAGYETIWNFLAETYNVNDPDSLKQLGNFIELFVEKVLVIAVDVETQTAWKTFEHANDRGIKLKDADNFKAYLFNNSSVHEHETIGENWYTMLQNLGQRSGELDTFLWKYSMAQESKLRIRREKTRKTLEEACKEKGAEKLSKKLAKHSRYYRNLLEGKHVQGTLSEGLQHLKKLHMSENMHVALLNTEHLTVEEFEETIWELSRIEIARRIVGENEKHSEQVMFKAGKILKENSAQEALTQLKNLINIALEQQNWGDRHLFEIFQLRTYRQDENLLLLLVDLYDQVRAGKPPRINEPGKTAYIDQHMHSNVEESIRHQLGNLIPETRLGQIERLKAQKPDIIWEDRHVLARTRTVGAGLYTLLYEKPLPDSIQNAEILQGFGEENRQENSTLENLGDYKLALKILEKIEEDIVGQKTLQEELSEQAETNIEEREIQEALNLLVETLVIEKQGSEYIYKANGRHGELVTGEHDEKKREKLFLRLILANQEIRRAWLNQHRFTNPENQKAADLYQNAVDTMQKLNQEEETRSLHTFEEIKDHYVELLENETASIEETLYKTVQNPEKTNTLNMIETAHLKRRAKLVEERRREIENSIFTGNCELCKNPIEWNTYTENLLSTECKACELLYL